MPGSRYALAGRKNGASFDRSAYRRRRHGGRRDDVALAPQAWALVPPRNCGMLEAKGRVFNIKADPLRRHRARRYPRRYLVRHVKPRGYRCRDYGRDTRIKFRCSKGAPVLFAIRR